MIILFNIFFLNFNIVFLNYLMIFLKPRFLILIWPIYLFLWFNILFNILSNKNINFLLRKVSNQFIKLLLPILLNLISCFSSCSRGNLLTISPNSCLAIVSIPVLLLLHFLLLLPPLLIWVLFSRSRVLPLFDVILRDFGAAHQLVLISIVIYESWVKLFNV